MTLLGLLVALVIAFFCVWAIQALAGAFNIPPQIRTVVMVLVVLIFLLWFVQAIGLLPSGPVLRLR